MIYVNNSLIQSPTTRGINYTTYCLQEMNKATACDIREHIIYHSIQCTTVQSSCPHLQKNASIAKTSSILERTGSIQCTTVQSSCLFAKKCKFDGVKNQVPFSVPLCFRSCSCPLQGGVSYLRLDCIFLCCHGPLSTTCTYNSITPTAINFEVLIPYEKMCAE